jgi:hypothetical protein
MIAKFSFLDTFIKYVFSIFGPFCPHLTSKFAKSANMINFFGKNAIRLSKKAELYSTPIPNPLKKIAKKLLRKSYQEKKATEKWSFLLLLL